MNNLFPNTGGVLNTGDREAKAFLRAVRSNLEHLHFVAAGRKLSLASQRIAGKVPPSLFTYLDGLSRNIQRGQLASSMSLPAFDAAIAQAAAQAANMRAQEANRIRREQNAIANKARRNAEEAARQRNAQRKLAANRVRRQAEANARAAQRIAEKREREAAEAKRAANEAREAKLKANEERAAAANKARFNASRAKGTGPSRPPNASVNERTKAAVEQHRKKARAGANAAAQFNSHKNNWNRRFNALKSQGLTTRSAFKRLARNNLGVILNSQLPNSGALTAQQIKKITVLLHPNKERGNSRKSALRTVLTQKIGSL